MGKLRAAFKRRLDGTHAGTNQHDRGEDLDVWITYPESQQTGLGPIPDPTLRVSVNGSVSVSMSVSVSASARVSACRLQAGKRDMF